MDLIDRQAAIDILEVAINDDWEFDYAKDRMNELHVQPEIILCEECKYWRDDHTCREHSLVSPMMANEYCSRAEMKGEE